MATTYQPTFGNTTIIPELIIKAWGKSTWDFGKKDSYFSKFIGSGRENIIQVWKTLVAAKAPALPHNQVAAADFSAGLKAEFDWG